MLLINAIYYPCITHVTLSNVSHRIRNMNCVVNVSKNQTGLLPPLHIVWVGLSAKLNDQMSEMNGTTS